MSMHSSIFSTLKDIIKKSQRLSVTTVTGEGQPSNVKKPKLFRPQNKPGALKEELKSGKTYTIYVIERGSQTRRYKTLVSTSRLDFGRGGWEGQKDSSRMKYNSGK